MSIIPVGTGYNKFKDSKTIYKVEFGKNCKEIGNNAFEGCINLKEINDSNVIESIGQYAFANTSISNVKFDKVNTIGNNAFENCNSLSNITICSTCSSIGNYAFKDCTSLSYIVLPNKNYNCILNDTFKGCSGLTSITIPSSVESIRNDAFGGCTGLNRLRIENGEKELSLGYNSSTNKGLFCDCPLVTLYLNRNLSYNTGSYGYSPFYNIKTLKSVTIGNSVTRIGSSAFYGCTGLPSITIPNSVESIGERAFSYCIGLTSTTIGDKVESIEGWAFYGCSGLTSIKIPNSVTRIGTNAFSNCEKLSIYNYSKILITKNDGVAQNVKEIYTIVNDYKFIQKDNKNILIEYIGDDTELNLPDYFFGQDYIIGDNTFKDNTKITSITIPSSVTTIGNSAFYGCDGLTSIEIPNSVTTIGDKAFYGCYGITSITVDKNNPVYDSRNNCNAIIETATNTLLWGFKNTIIPNSVTSIGDYAFKGCTYLTTLNLPEDLKSIGKSAFEDCENYTIHSSLNPMNLDLNLNDTLPTSLESIGDACFKNTGIETLIITENNNNLKNIPKSAFENCKKLNILDISRSNIKTIDDNAFNSNILSVTLPSTLEYLGNKSLYTVSEINVVINNGNDSIANPPKFKDSNSRPFNDDSKIYITKDYIDTYEKDDYWGIYKTNIYDHGYINDYIKDCYIKQESDGSNKLYITFNEFAPNEWENVKVIFNTYGNNNDIDYNKFITIKSDTLNYVLETNLDYPSNNNGQISTEVGYLKIIGIENSYIPFINDKKHTIKLDLQIQ